MSSTTISSLDPIQDLETLFSKISAICKRQFALIHHVFPSPAQNSTRELLVERLFNDPAFGIFSYLDQFLSVRRDTPPNPFATDMDAVAVPGAALGLSAANDAGLAYVRLLSAAYEKTCNLAQAIESIEPEMDAPGAARPTLERSSPAMDKDGDNLPSAAEQEDGEDGLSSDQERMRTFLNLQLHSLFGSHRQRYFRTELELVQRQFQDILSKVKFPVQLTPKQKTAAAKSKHNANASASAAAVSTAAYNSYATTQSSTNLGASSSNFERDGGSGTFSPPEVASVVFYETLLAIGDDDVVPDNYQLVMKESVERCEFILKDSDLRAELVTKIFTSFIASFGDEYLGVRRHCCERGR